MAIRTTVKLSFNEKPWKKMESRIKRLSSKSVRVGWWNSYYPDGISVAQVAAWNEEGHINGGMFTGTYTPPRPFIRTGFLPKAENVLEKYAKLMFVYFEGKAPLGNFWKMMSTELQEKMQQSILEFKIPANKSITIRLKGFNDPLIETGNMYDSVKTTLIKFSKSS